LKILVFDTRLVIMQRYYNKLIDASNKQIPYLFVIFYQKPLLRYNFANIVLPIKNRILVTAKLLSLTATLHFSLSTLALRL
jgi:hypothetical protein